MSLPIQISPSPIVTSTVELRINSTKKIHQIFSEVFALVHSYLPTVLHNDIPKNLPVAPQHEFFKYIPEYILSNKEYSLSIGENIISMTNVEEYMLWGNYYEFIKDTLKRLFSLNYIDSISRMGVRYASLFNNISDLSEILNFTPKMLIAGYDEKFNHFRSDFKKGNYNLHLQLFNNARVQKGNTLLSGAVIDIDASFIGDLSPSEDIIGIIDELHTEEKTLFFERLVKEDFVKTLNPKY